jgi:hypothetical protein
MLVASDGDGAGADGADVALADGCGEVGRSDGLWLPMVEPDGAAAVAQAPTIAETISDIA